MEKHSRTLAFLILRFIAICFSASCFAQQEHQRNFFPSAELKLGSIYASPFRNGDSTFRNQAVIGAVFIVRHKSGIGLSYAPLLLAAGHRLYAHEIGLSFEQFDKNSYSLIAELNHFFKEGNFGVPYSPINNEFYGSFVLNKRVISPVIKANIGFGKDSSENSSYAFSAMTGIGVSHSFTNNIGYFIWKFTPSLIANWGTNQNFQWMQEGQYYSPIYSPHFNQALSDSDDTQPAPVKRTFKLMNAEAGIESEFEWQSFFLRSDLSYFIPLHPSPEKRVEKYWRITIGVNF